MKLKEIKEFLRKPSLIFCENLSRVYLVITAVNDGATGVVFGIPYLIYLLLISKHDFSEGRKFNASINCLFIMLFICFGFTDRSENQFLYPLVGQTFEFKEGIEFVNSETPFVMNNGKCNKQSFCRTFKFNKGDKFKILKQKLVGNSDFGTQYFFTALPENEELARGFNKYALELIQLKKKFTKPDSEVFISFKNSFEYFLKGVGKETSLKDLGESKKMFFHSRWLHENSKKLIYEEDYYGLTNGAISMIFLHLVIYLPVGLIFILTVGFYSPVPAIKGFVL